jgi:CBS domain-containing protein/sporulation protein YlmC with PRC-barrel domain
VIYLSQLIDAPIWDAGGTKLGVIGDIAVDLREPLPRVTGLWMKGDRIRVAIIPWEAVAEIEPAGARLNLARHQLHPRPLQPDEFLLAETILDTQVVDTNGLKVVRVNDVQLKRTNGDVRLIATDVGLTGLLRRLKLESFAQRVTRIMGRTLSDNLIPWKMVATFGGPMTPLKLSISREKLQEIHPADLAQIMDDLDRDERVELMTTLTNADAAEALAEAEPKVQSDTVKSLPSELAADIIEAMEPDDATDILSDLRPEKAGEIISLMAGHKADAVRRLLKHPEGTAGSIMTTEFIALPESLTVDETIQRLRTLAPKEEQAYYLHVIDAQGRLIGVLSIRALIISQPERRIAEIMSSEIVSVSVNDSVETVAAALRKYNLMALPVLDESNHLVGTVTIDDVLDIVLGKKRNRVGVTPQPSKRAF